jgi:hypothetical protein
VDEPSFRCGQVSVRREAANVLPIIAGIRQCSAVGVRLGQCRHISMSKLGSIITSALPVATMLICQRACICVGVCVWVLQCEETCLHALRFVSPLPKGVVHSYP